MAPEIEQATDPKPSGDAMIDIVDMHKWYGDFHVLKGIDLSIAEKERIVICGPSGSGKTTLYKELVKKSKFKKRLAKTVSVTTRPKREGEKHGRDYFFVSRRMFEYKIRAKHFLEYEKVFDHYYGTSKKQIRDLYLEARQSC